MKEINLRDYYRTYRYKAFYSLDYDGNIERDVALSQPSLLEIMEQRRMTDLLYQGLDTLTEKQRQRIYAHFFLGMSNADIARLEGCDITSVRGTPRHTETLNLS